MRKLLGPPSAPVALTEDESLEETLAKAEALRAPAPLGAQRQPATSPLVAAPYSETSSQRVEELPKLKPQDEADILSALSQVQEETGQSFEDIQKKYAKTYEMFRRLEKAERAGSEERIQKALDAFTEERKKPMTNKDLFAQLLIGIAPQLIGAAAGSAMGIGYAAGGAAGGTAALTGLTYLEKLRKEAEEKGDKLAEARLKIQIEKEKEKLEPLRKGAEKSLEGALEAPLVGAKALATIGATRPDLLKDIRAGMTGQVKVQTGEKKGLEFKTLPEGQEPLSREFGGNFYLEEGFSKKNREDAQKLVSNYNALSSAIGDLKKAVKTAGIKGATKWTDAGQIVQQKIAALQEAMRAYNNSGAGFTESEQANAASMGMSPKGDLSETLKMTFTPESLVSKLSSMDRSARGRTALMGRPYGLRDRGSPEKLAIQEKLGKLTPAQRLQLQQAPAGQKAKKLKELLGE